MDRYNPFAISSSMADDTDPFTTNFNRSNPKTSTLGRQAATRTDSNGSGRYVGATPLQDVAEIGAGSPASRYTTSFPDPFAGLEEGDISAASPAPPPPPPPPAPPLPPVATTGSATNRSNSVTFAPSSHSIDDSTSSTIRQTRSGLPGSGISSFLSRATSVTSSSVTDRMSEAMRSAVDSISNQIQQAVPANLNERLSSTANNLIASADQLQQQPQSTASYLASKISSATGQFTSSGQSANSMPIISRQRVVLIIDNPCRIDWAQEFNNYKRLTSGLGQQSSGGFFFSSATSQLNVNTSGGSPTSCDGADLIEQADFRTISVLANQISSTVTIYVTNESNNNTNKQQQTTLTGSGSSSSSQNGILKAIKIVRPEYVVVKQRTKDRLDHMRGIVGALNYCLVPMFEPIEVWNVFQDRQMIFAKLLRVQKALGKENFPLIPQIYCQTHQDLLNYVNGSSFNLPCLVRTGPLGNGKIKIDNLSMFRYFASIVATNNSSCTVEQYLDVKCDLIVQKLGTSLKLFRKNIAAQTVDPNSTYEPGNGAMADNRQQEQQQYGRQTASRQASLGSSILSSLIPSSSQQQASRRSSNPAALAYEKLTEVSVRYKSWVDEIMQEFDNKLDAFCIKIAVASNDREYIVGLNNCSMDFLGSLENQDEDKRSFVELIISKMNTVLPKHSVSRQSSSNVSSTARRKISGDTLPDSPGGSMSLPPMEKKKFTSQTQINGINNISMDRIGGHIGSGSSASRAYGQLSSRSQSVSVNQSDYLANEPGGINRSSYFTRRGSDRSDSQTAEDNEDLSGRDGSIYSSSTTSGLHQRQSSLGQSLFDQTSTAFSSFQRQSMSFFKRLDSRAGEMSNTPPMSAKSDIGFDRAFKNKTNTSTESTLLSKGATVAGYKSQSVDNSIIEKASSLDRPKKREAPQKPPPPQLGNRQSSLASYSSSPKLAPSVTPNTTPVHMRQSLDNKDAEAGRPTRVVRQNSALSAFEPFDADIITEQQQTDSFRRKSSQSQTDLGSNQPDTLDRVQKVTEFVRKNVNFDSASTTSGNSNSTGETTTAEDTMNNLKKTFASIFGDKCE